MEVFWPNSNPENHNSIWINFPCAKFSLGFSLLLLVRSGHTVAMLPLPHSCRAATLLPGVQKVETTLSPAWPHQRGLRPEQWHRGAHLLNISQVWRDFCTGLTWAVYGELSQRQTGGVQRVCSHQSGDFNTLYNCSSSWKCSCLSGSWSAGQKTSVSSGWKSALYISALMLLRNQNPWSTCRKSARNSAKADFIKWMAVVFPVVYSFF